MPSTYDAELVGSILGQIEEAIDTIRIRTRSIQRPDDFTATPEGREKLDRGLRDIHSGWTCSRR